MLGKLKSTRHLIAFVLVSLLVLAVPANVMGLDRHLQVEVSLDVADTQLVVKGQTAPQSFVTVLRDGAIVGSVISDSDGQFEKLLASQTPGLHNVQVFSRTADGQTTDTISQTISLISHTKTTLTVFLPTTLNEPAGSIQQGQTARFSGATIPNGQVTLLADNNISSTTTANAFGLWQIDVDTANFYLGTHYAYAQVTDAFGAQSSPTSKRSFVVVGGAGTTAPARPLEKPNITSPKNNQRFSQPSVQVCGTAAANRQVEVWRNDSVAGSSFTGSAGEWCLDLRLQPGEQQLKARVCEADSCSPFSDAITVFYDKPIGAPPPFDFYLEQYRFSKVRAGQSIALKLTLRNGQQPYDTVIDWGNQVVERTTLNNGQATLHFTYDTPGQYSGVVSVQDGSGQMQSLHFSVLVSEKSRGFLLVAGGVLAIILMVLAVMAYVYKRSRQASEATNL